MLGPVYVDLCLNRIMEGWSKARVSVDNRIGSEHLRAAQQRISYRKSTAGIPSAYCCSYAYVIEDPFVFIEEMVTARLVFVFPCSLALSSSLLLPQATRFQVRPTPGQIPESWLFLWLFDRCWSKKWEDNSALWPLCVQNCKSQDDRKLQKQLSPQTRALFKARLIWKSHPRRGRLQ